MHFVQLFSSLMVVMLEHAMIHLSHGVMALDERLSGVYDLKVSPSRLEDLHPHQMHYITFNLTSLPSTSTPDPEIRSGNLVINVTTSNLKVARVFLKASEIGGDMHHSLVPTRTLAGKVNRAGRFILYGLHTGRLQITLRIVEKVLRLSSNSTIVEVEGACVVDQNYEVGVIRKRRTADVGFEAAITMVSIILSLGMGCTTDVLAVKSELNRPRGVLAGVLSWFLCLPLLAAATAKALNLDVEHGIGLVYVACIPGGGMAHLIVTIISGNRALSMTLHMFGTIAPLVTAPLWLLLMNLIFPLRNPNQQSLPLDRLELWLAMLLTPYLIGIFINQCLPNVAEAILNWFVKPFMLLTFILYITLGSYINTYAFDLLYPKVVIASALLPCLGLSTGALTSLALRVPHEDVKTVATECAISHCFAAIVAMRSLRKPEDDLASSVAMWVLFMTLLPFVATKAFLAVKKVVLAWCRKQKDKQQEHVSILAGIDAMRQLGTLHGQILKPKFPDAIMEEPVFERDHDSGMTVTSNTATTGHSASERSTETDNLILIEDKITVL